MYFDNKRLTLIDSLGAVCLCLLIVFVYVWVCGCLLFQEYNEAFSTHPSHMCIVHNHDHDHDPHQPNSICTRTYIIGKYFLSAINGIAKLPFFTLQFVVLLLLLFFFAYRPLAHALKPIVSNHLFHCNFVLVSACMYRFNYIYSVIQWK